MLVVRQEEATQCVLLQRMESAYTLRLGQSVVFAAVDQKLRSRPFINVVRGTESKGRTVDEKAGREGLVDCLLFIKFLARFVPWSGIYDLGICCSLLKRHYLPASPLVVELLQN